MGFEVVQATRYVLVVRDGLDPVQVELENQHPCQFIHACMIFKACLVPVVKSRALNNLKEECGQMHVQVVQV